MNRAATWAYDALSAYGEADGVYNDSTFDMQQEMIYRYRSRLRRGFGASYLLVHARLPCPFPPHCPLRLPTRARAAPSTLPVKSVRVAMTPQHVSAMYPDLPGPFGQSRRPGRFATPYGRGWPPAGARLGLSQVPSRQATARAQAKGG